MIQIKNAKELDGMRRANALSAAALKYGGEHIEAGMTTWELDKLIYDFIVKHGGIPNFKGLYGFPGTACISLNDTVIHGIPSHDIVIRPGDIVSIDTGAKVDGFNGDNACTYAEGKVDLEAQRLLEMTKASLYLSLIHISRLSSCAASMACAATTVPTSVSMRTPPLSLWPKRTPRVLVSLDLLLASCVMPATPRSVSYTHLDVYKRQAMLWS